MAMHRKHFVEKDAEHLYTRSLDTLEYSVAPSSHISSLCHFLYMNYMKRKSNEK